MYMNDYEIARMLDLFAHDVNRPVLGKAVRFLADFKEEVDSHSDGWAHWRAPVASAKQLMTLLPRDGSRPVQDITEAQYRKALGPIKAFFTRKGAAAGMILPPTNI